MIYPVWQQVIQDGLIDASELWQCLHNHQPDIQHQVQRLVVKHHSEWLKDGMSALWQAALDEQRKSYPELALYNQEYINKLVWMKEVPEIRSNKALWHMHPVVFLGTLKYDSGLINVSDFLDIYAREHIIFTPGISTPLSQKSYNNLKKLLDNINDYYSNTLDYKPNLYKLAYMLATVRHETYNYVDVEYFSEGSEIGGVSYFDKYDPVLASTQNKKDKAVANGNTSQGDGYKYRGRGCVHLTWKSNYQKAKEKFGLDFVSNPDIAGDFLYALPIMVWGMEEGIFTGLKLSSYINSNSIDYENARKVINGSDQKYLISSYAKKFQSILEQASTASKDF